MLIGNKKYRIKMWTSTFMLVGIFVYSMEVLKSCTRGIG